MNRIGKVALVVVLALGMGACCTPKIESGAVDNLKATNDLIFPEYIKLVEKEYASDPAKIDNRKKLVQSANDIVTQMKANASK